MNPITAKQMQVIERVGKGMSNREIAADLQVNITTVERYLRAIYVKLNIYKPARAKLINRFQKGEFK